MKKKLLSLFMTAILTVSMVCPVMAGTWNDDGGTDTRVDDLGATYNGTGTGYGGTYTSDGSETGTESGYVKITATIDSTYKIVVPSSLNLTKKAGENDTYEGTGNIGCYGNINSTSKVAVALGQSVEDPTSHEVTFTANQFKMTGATVGDVTGGTITFEKSDFVHSSVSPLGSSEIAIIGADAANVANSPFTAAIDLTGADAYTGTITVQFGLAPRS